MAQIAKGRVPRAVGIRAGRAEALPFRDAWFDGVVFSLVIHLVERGPALAEAARVLVPGGRVVIATFAHEHFDVYWAARYFPSIGTIDRRRFPTGQQLAEELTIAGFDTMRSERISSHTTITREHALERIRGRHISTFDLLDAAELEEGPPTPSATSRPRSTSVSSSSSSLPLARISPGRTRPRSCRRAQGCRARTNSAWHPLRPAVCA